MGEDRRMGQRRFRTNRVKSLLRQGKPAFGTFVYLQDPAVSDLLGHAGLDFVVIDLEHTSLSLEAVENHVRAANSSGTTPFVRVPENDPKLINRVLETGAAGIMIPQLRDRADAERAVAAVKYPPQGGRGMCRVTRATSYREESFWDYAAEANEETMVIALVETKEAVAVIDEITQVAGIDVILPGRGDLSSSYGMSGHLEHPMVNAAADRVIKAASQTTGMSAGMVVFKADEARSWIDKGALFMMFSQDSRILMNSYRAAIQIIRAALSEPNGAR